MLPPYFSGPAAAIVAIVLLLSAALLVKAQVSGRRRAEEDFLQQTGLLKSILDNMGEGVVVADQAGKFLVFNPVAERILGIGMTPGGPESWPATYGTFLTDETTPWPAGDLPLTRAIRGEETSDAPMFIRNARVPKGVWISVSGNPIRTPRGRLVGGVVVFRDVTGKKRREEEKQKLIKDLERSNINLAAVNKELEAFSHWRRKKISKSTVDMEALMISTFEDLKNIHRADLPKLTLKELPKAHGDPALVHQVVTNLLSNAIKFTEKTENGSILVGGKENERECEYFVQDNGAGFDMRYAHKLFEAFHGTGVGLAIVQRLVNRHGGRVWAHGKVNSGATFNFTLPKK